MCGLRGQTSKSNVTLLREDPLLCFAKSLTYRIGKKYCMFCSENFTAIQILRKIFESYFILEIIGKNIITHIKVLILFVAETKIYNTWVFFFHFNWNP